MGHTIRPHDVVLAYLQNKQKGAGQDILMGIHYLLNFLVEKGVYSAIDFTFYKHQDTTSDVIHDILWEFTYSELIKETGGVYEMTDYGNRIVDNLLKSFNESQGGRIFSQVINSSEFVHKHEEESK